MVPKLLRARTGHQNDRRPKALPFVLLGGTGLLLAACAAGTPATPVATDVFMTPRVVDPGQTFQIGYRISPGSSATQVASAEIIGLPPNSLAAGTGPRVTIPPAGNVIQRTDVTLLPPAKDGIYPLTLRLTTQDGRVSDTPIGTLTVNNVPARIEHVQVNPSNHRVAACAGQPININVSYTVTDPNGANDLRDPRVVRVQGVSTLGGTIGAPYPAQTASTNAPAGSYYSIVNPASSLASNPPPVATSTTIPGRAAVAQPLPPQAVPQSMPQTSMVAAAPGGTIALPPNGVPLSPPTHANAAQETVATPLTIACDLAAPAQWDWIVQGSDDDPARNQIVTTNQATAKYFTSR